MLRFARRRWRSHLHQRARPDRGDATVAAIRQASGTADFVSAELSDASSVRSLANQGIELGNGQIDTLVNNAATFPFEPTTDVSDEELDATAAVNVKAPFLLVAALALGMVTRGSGAIVNISTMVANFEMPAMALEGSSKAALRLLTSHGRQSSAPSEFASTP
ncbi:SDR family NAD(P)-dependent oxidoreductase [Subtercola lobariae]|uniref:SDR family NAD(P)-dependent oxidoreductase n=1 Tax=Subtercola lobariae TaxID=1588641 RepID=A0A917BAU5_9MICO|nr:SDR family oxidoreductase [Subtercola lobariae]GGF33939.1 hypothetical protein GCM10011399_28890 [Subtercola lobariae]